MKDKTLYEVRCQNTVWKGNTEGLKCQSLCGMISAISMGEFWCRKCKVRFNFYIPEGGEVMYFDVIDTPASIAARKKAKKKAEKNLSNEARLISLVDGEEDD